jgi:lipopolysaccharide/colanic/teichoic acid biosynthesis glycosyltransferase
LSTSKYLHDVDDQSAAAAKAALPADVLLDEQTFERMILCERKRSERSGKPFLLMLVESGFNNSSGREEQLLLAIVSALATSTRDTDVKGWQKVGHVVGVIFTEIGDADQPTIVATMLTRVSDALRDVLSADQFSRIGVSFHAFPTHYDVERPNPPANPTLYPDVAKRENARKSLRIIKRAIDVAGSLFALILFAPVFVVISLAIKLSSKGPVLFRQMRVGQNGIPFIFVKFRSMSVNNDSAIHKEYVRRLIAGKVQQPGSNGNGNESGHVYKLTTDSRITPVGNILRRTSLDELPQLLNVLRGEMSLVGPRPPIAYEVEAYDVWHRSRLLEVKPGITGLWQVNGRSRVTFDEMVRLDLRYAREWSPWLDIKILLRTPRAVVNGAY